MSIGGYHLGFFLISLCLRRSFSGPVYSPKGFLRSALFRDGGTQALLLEEVYIQNLTKSNNLNKVITFNHHFMGHSEVAPFDGQDSGPSPYVHFPLRGHEIPEERLRSTFPETAARARYINDILESVTRFQANLIGRGNIFSQLDDTEKAHFRSFFESLVLEIRSSLESLQWHFAYSLKGVEGRPEKGKTSAAIEVVPQNADELAASLEHSLEVLDSLSEIDASFGNLQKSILELKARIQTLRLEIQRFSFDDEIREEEGRLADLEGKNADLVKIAAIQKRIDALRERHDSYSTGRQRKERRLKILEDQSVSLEDQAQQLLDTFKASLEKTGTPADTSGQFRSQVYGILSREQKKGIVVHDRVRTAREGINRPIAPAILLLIFLAVMGGHYREEISDLFERPSVRLLRAEKKRMLTRWRWAYDEEDIREIEAIQSIDDWNKFAERMKSNSGKYYLRQARHDFYQDAAEDGVQLLPEERKAVEEAKADWEVDKIREEVIERLRLKKLKRAQGEVINFLRFVNAGTEEEFSMVESTKTLDELDDVVECIIPVIRDRDFVNIQFNRKTKQLYIGEEKVNDGFLPSFFSRVRSFLRERVKL